MPIRDQQFAVLKNGITLHYISAGVSSLDKKQLGEKPAPLVLFLHGFPEASFAWEAQLEALAAQGYYAVAPDLRGFNLSSMPPNVEQYRAKHMVYDISLFADFLGYDKFVLVSHDWGGAVAWQCALAWPQRITKFISINSPHPITFARELAHNPAQQAASEYMNWLRAEGSEHALAKDNFTRLKNMLLSMNGADDAASNTWFNPALQARYCAMWARGLSGGVNYYRATPLHPPTKTAAGAKDVQFDDSQFVINLPTKIIWGERDIALLPALLNGLEALLPNLQLVKVADASHWIVHEKPDFVSQEILKFISDIPPT